MEFATGWGYQVWTDFSSLLGKNPFEKIATSDSEYLEGWVIFVCGHHWVEFLVRPNRSRNTRIGVSLFWVAQTFPGI
jgi:hypothetical protein